MKVTEQLKKELNNGSLDKIFKRLYCSDNVECYEKRFSDLIESYENTFGTVKNLSLFSAPGRTELGGNHTDHQHGCVLAASINLDIIAAVATNNDNVIRIQSEGFPLDEIDLNNLEPNEKEFNRASSLIRGIAAKFINLGYEVKGFNAYTVSNVLKGSGLSSSAAFEVLIGTIISELFCSGKVDAVEIAKIGQYAENVYFGKPCGLMDQMASSVGGIISIDFANPMKPLIQNVNYDFKENGYALCIIDSGADHSDLTDEYAAITTEMKKVANYIGKDFLRDIDKQQFMDSLADIRTHCGDRAVLRALHFFNENERAVKEIVALKENNLEKFYELVNESGRSSYMYLQNVNPAGSIKEQAVGIVIALCEEYLKCRGAYRVHGGGFAGTVQAFVPLEILESFRHNIENVAGHGKCHVVSVRPVGGIKIA